MADMNKVAEAFVGHYFQTFDTNRANLASLYQGSSMMSFEGEQFQGSENIVRKLTSLPFQKVVHAVKSFDVQPSGNNNGLLIVVSGDLTVDQSPNPLKFAQTFQILPAGNSWWVQNDVFRLNYG